jgi:hypothetical protein
VPLVGKDAGETFLFGRLLQGLGQKEHDTDISLSR